MKTSVIVTGQVEGFHNWKDAPKKHEFLKSRHRHMFHFRVVKSVEHNDRAIEIIDFKREIIDWFLINYGTDNQFPLEFKSMSCEQIAVDICFAFQADSVEIIEDGENGALVTKE